MTRFACIIVVLVSGCSFDVNALRAPALDAGLDPPRLGSAGVDAGTAPDLRMMPDTIANVDSVLLGDTKPQNTDSGTFTDTKPQIADTLPTLPIDTQAPPDTLSCMQRVVANGYASDKASCATGRIKFEEPYNSNLAVPWTSQSACKFIIDCFAAKPDVYTSWHKQPNCDCTCPIPGAGYEQLLADIVTPFCPAFFTL
jgi:hypothetical protein